MKDFYIFVESVYYIEENLSGRLCQKDIARHCGCSLSALQKMWKYCTRRGVMEYVRRRRLTVSAREITQGASVLDTAIKYAYNSNEAFTRSFRSFWGITPSEFARSRSFTELYPCLDLSTQDGGIFMRVRFDLTELFEQLRNKEGSYVVCFDIKNLMAINAVSRDLGDEVIRKAAERIDNALTDGMFAFRIGGDEFAVATGLTDITEAQQFMESVTAGNSDIAAVGADTAPVYLHSGIMLYEGPEGDFHEKFENSVVRK